MKITLWTVVVIALEVLLVCGAFASFAIGGPLLSTTVVVALLVGVVSVVVWIGYISVFEQTLHILVVVIVACVILTYAALAMVTTFAQIPTAVVCDRRAPNTEVHITSTAPQGRFVKSYIGACVLYTHVSRPVPSLRGGAGSGD
jgi:hypothetical protein